VHTGNGIVIFVIMHNQINTEPLQYQEENEIKIPANEKKDITHEAFLQISQRESYLSV